MLCFFAVKKITKFLMKNRYLTSTSCLFKRNISKNVKH